MKNTTLVIYSLFSLIIIFIFYVFYLLNCPLKPLELIGIFPVKTPIVESGDKLIYTANYCKDAKLGAGRVARTLIGELIYNLPETYGTVAPGCHKVDLVVPIPKEVSPGKYYMQIVATYVVNQLRTVTEETRTDYFNIK